MSLLHPSLDWTVNIGYASIQLINALIVNHISNKYDDTQYKF